MLKPDEVIIDELPPWCWRTRPEALCLSEQEAHLGMGSSVVLSESVDLDSVHPMLVKSWLRGDQ